MTSQPHNCSPHAARGSLIPHSLVSWKAPAPHSRVTCSIPPNRGHATLAAGILTSAGGSFFSRLPRKYQGGLTSFVKSAHFYLSLKNQKRPCKAASVDSVSAVQARPVIEESHRSETTCETSAFFFETNCSVLEPKRFK